jgi:tetratricopeptide (TPR) repeat protein
VSERIGITDVSIQYDRPAVKGREEKIWGQLIPVGFTDQNFGSSKAAPWRAGANECTTIDFSTDVTIENQPLAKGKYGFFIAYDANECTLIFSRNTTNWGSYYYDPKEDALRVKVKPVTTDRSVEWLKYEFTNETETTATINLLWEKLSIPFKVEVDLNKTQVDMFRTELRTDKGFFWLGWQTAAQWCADHNTNLEEALRWADTATNPTVLGDRSFVTLSTKAQILVKLNRGNEALAVMKEALPLGNMNQLHQYGRSLLAQKQNKEALEVYKINFEKYPNQFTTLTGLARGYSGMGDYKKALEYMEKAAPMAPNPVNKVNIDKMIGLLKEGKDIN